jgi:hypothetical protein
MTAHYPCLTVASLAEVIKSPATLGGRFSAQNIDNTSRLIEDDDVARYAHRG